ncbi:LysR family transcriptional regulator [Virgibacillus alimentarius]|uniref:DNA-binding transcriptional LysR family regulator n=1 Tax=Virgibacillus alimentarius TaxID=698769 RepID=A0ABS4S9W7_9BACI|nr:LysR family transcriptional regulator [Virgibacillus alimentarius]MBP2258204.1 DNA-binding transcriptional LysR family regulator [Virgibacillus alimentarius]
MDIRQLRYFYTIANEGQITRAAKRLHMAQPPLSQSLKALESELGVTLLERNGRKMELTEAGMVLYKKTEGIFQHFDETITEVKETGEGLRGKLSIGCVKSCFSYVPPRMHLFLKKYPKVTFELREGDSYRLAELLNDRHIDLAIVRLPLEMKAFSHFLLPDEEYVAVLPKQWGNGTSGKSISITDLADIPLLLLHRISGVGQYEIVINKFEKYGLTPNVVCECPDADMLLELVNEGIGATVIPESALSRLHLQEAKVMQIKEAELISRSAVIWAKDRYLSKSATRFIELFQSKEHTLQLH